MWLVIKNVWKRLVNKTIQLFLILGQLFKLVGWQGQQNALHLSDFHGQFKVVHTNHVLVDPHNRIKHKRLYKHCPDVALASRATVRN